LHCGLIFDPGLIDEHHGDIIAHRVDTMALDAFEPIFIVFWKNLRFANGAHKYFQQFLADWHVI
jgi:hypothetical protein